MAVIVEKTANIAAAPETVWGLLANLESWQTWWGDCVAAGTTDFAAFREGVQLEVVLQPRHRKLTFKPVVDMLTEGKTLSLTHQSATLRGTVVWNVAEGPTGTKVVLRGVFKGLRVWLLGLASASSVFQLTLSGSLRGLKKLAERMA